MIRGRKWLAAAAIAVVAVGAGTGIAVAGGGDDDASDAPITGTELDRATTAALHETGGGDVVATEIDDEEGFYEVEVKLDDGSHVDVHLDRSFNVIDSKADGDNQEDEGQN
jgi:uncharacterized membrane protein YkoI